MKAFAGLYAELDRTTSTLAKVSAMARYFGSAPDEEAAWAFFLLSGQRFKRLIGPRKLAQWAMEAAAVPEWLFDECYAAAGDLAETIALLIERSPDAAADDASLAGWVRRVRALRKLDEPEQRQQVEGWWRQLPRDERYLLNKLLTGALRVGVSRTLAIRGLAEASGIERDLLQHRLTGTWTPSAQSWRELTSTEGAGEASLAQPYPFYLASPWDGNLSALGAPDEWMVEWKWDGIRAQLVRRGGQTFLWSRGEELLTERFPEIVAASEPIADGTVLDGELLVWDHAHDRPHAFAQLQKRIGRKKIGPKILREAPAYFMAYDLLERDGEDWRERTQRQRRAALEVIIAELDAQWFGASAVVVADTWDELESLRSQSRARGVEGFMIKQANGLYLTGRRKGGWWKHKVDPFTLDCVLIYAQAGSGKRAGLFTDYTFALRDDAGELVPIAKAYSGLDDEEIRELDAWIRRNTIERFGPVRSVAAEHVFEIAFEGIRPSTRHKAGLAVRFPRIARWRRDKAPEDADTLASARTLLAVPPDK